MEQKATVVFDPIEKTLTIKGELLPHQPIVHDKLVELVSGELASLETSFKVEKDIVTYSFTFKKRAEVQEPSGLPSAADLDIVANEAAQTQDAS